MEFEDENGYRIIGTSVADGTARRENFKRRSARKQVCLGIAAGIMFLIIIILGLYIGVKFAIDHIEKSNSTSISSPSIKEETVVLEMLENIWRLGSSNTGIPRNLFVLRSSSESISNEDLKKNKMEWTHVCVTNSSYQHYKPQITNKLLNEKFPWMKNYFSKLDKATQQSLLPFLYLYSRGGLHIQDDLICGSDKPASHLKDNQLLLFKDENNKITERIFGSNPGNPILLIAVQMLIKNPKTSNSLKKAMEKYSTVGEEMKIKIIPGARFDSEICKSFDQCRYFSHRNGYSITQMNP